MVGVEVSVLLEGTWPEPLSQLEDVFPLQLLLVKGGGGERRVSIEIAD